MLINNQFVFLPIPRNASTSVYVSVKTWGIPVNFGIKSTNEKLKNSLIDDFNTFHYHYDYVLMKTIFPDVPLIGIKRDSTDRFISGVYYLINFLYQYRIKFGLKHDFINFNNDDFISFFKDFFEEYHIHIKKNNVYGNFDGVKKLANKYFYDYISTEEENLINDIKIDDAFTNFLCVILSQYRYGIQYCDEIIDIKNLKILEDRIKSFKPNFNLVKVNEKNKFFNLNIQKTNKLEEFVNEYIDKPFLTKKLF
jgi:hypothetical protein